MTQEEFISLLDLYGSKFDLWPSGAAESGRELVQSSPDMAALYQEAMALDAALDAYEIPMPSAAFEARLLDLAPTSPAPTQAKNSWFARFNMRLVSTGVASLACAAFGLVIGFQSVQAVQADVTAESDAFIDLAAYSLSDDFGLGEEG